MVALQKKTSDASSIASDSKFNKDDDFSDVDDDEFGTKTGGWCCFTSSLPIVYLCMWLNEKPNLTSFVSRQIPIDVQLDTGNVNSSKKQRASESSISAKSNRSIKKSPNKQVAEALIGYIRAKEAVAVQPQNISNTLSEELESFKHSQSRKEKIELLEKQISVVTRRVHECRTDDEHERYSRVLQKLEDELDNLVLPH
jgi:hypothetical protein